LDKDNIVNFPSNESEHEEHICDGCTSYAIHRLTHNFETVDEEEIIHRYLDRIFDAIDEENGKDIADAVIELYHEAFDLGSREVLKGELHRLSAVLAAMTNDVDGEEQ
jgi:hypothetical protein